MELQVIKNGTPVTTKIGSIRGIVIEIRISGKDLVTYVIGYFHDGDYKTANLYEDEIDVDSKDRIRIGFKNV